MSRAPHGWRWRWALSRSASTCSPRAIGDEFALRDQDDAGDREHQHQRQAEQRIDRAIGDAVLDQEQHDRRVQDRALPSRVEPIKAAGRRDRRLKAAGIWYNL